MPSQKTVELPEMTKYPQDDFKPYDDGRSKTEQVEAMFDRIAPQYDRMNRTMSFGTDRGWRKAAIRHLSRYAPRKVLDVATGTGDFAIEAYRGLLPDVVVATDISEGMMRIGAWKVKAAGLDSVISFKKEDCEHMSYDDGSFDAITTAFGIRNFQNLDACLKEMCRVLRKGGQLSILELSRPVRFPMKQLFGIYSHSILPLYGKIVSKDDEAYKYLISTIESFPQGEEMVGIFKKAGFSTAKFKRLTFGVCTCYFAIK